MPNTAHLSRRERQIMNVLFARGEATVLQITEDLPDPPTPMAVRRMLHILVEKGHLKRRQEGREMVYAPREARKRAGTNAFQNVLETFFSGSLEEALSAHLVSRKEKVSDEERDRLLKLIQKSREQGR
jgi:predicted transcriptional regulator